MTRRSLLGRLEQLVLAGILQVGEGAYAALVLRWLEESTGRAANRGSFYVTLDRKEAKGLLRSWASSDDGQRGGRPRRYLEVTPAGFTALREARSQLLDAWTGIEHLLGDER